ncbi:MAG: DNA polymerase III subunit alpha [Fidelibacterota bacterium]|nr:MAG: DNA polymerase III subunit alpha [Candidatus Neomarinimicrobiota bacterium]
MFCHLNVHSHASPMRGTVPIEALVDRARELGMSHLALTDVNGLWGFVRFTQLAHQAGLQPVCGTHVLLGGSPDTPPAQDVVLLVENPVSGGDNHEGYANLCRLLSRVHDEPDSDLATLLETFGEGLFVLCPYPTLLQRLAGILSADHIYGELRPGRDSTPILTACDELGLEPVATGEVCFLAAEDAELYHLLRAIDRNERLSDLPQWELKSSAHHFADEAEISRRYPHCPQAIDNAAALARRCQTEWDFSATIFPGAAPGSDANAELQRLVYAGAVRRYHSPLAPEVVARIEKELDLIGRKGFAPYFLVVADIVGQNRLTIGRGSGAASIVSYCLFITQVDPLRHNLTFERFLHEERTDLPDIDVDFAWDERDDVLAYVFKKYGRERAAMVANHVTLQPRAAVREVAKVFGLSNEEILAVTRRIALVFAEAGHANLFGRDIHPLHLDTTSLPTLETASAPALNLDDTLQRILNLAMRLVGIFHYPSVHSGGVIVVPDEIRRYVPVLTAPKGVPIVQWEKDQVEDAGLVKIDLLGNRSLAVVRDCLRHINLYRRSQDHLSYHHIQPMGDARTAALMQQGRTMGIFYIESPATRQLLARAGQVDFEHVVIYSSIIRPAANRFINLLIERIHGAPWELLHPDLDFLNESYGIMVYEEQVFLAAVALAGFSYSEADTLRKIGTKKSLRPMIPTLKEKFISQAISRDYNEDMVRQIWDMIESFQGYSFCKPHSASYAMLSFTCAYLKTHYPAEFLAAVISNRGGYYSPYAYMSEARRRGVTILLPHINRSLREWKGHRDKIRVGFMEIRSLQAGSIEAILKERKRGDFTSLADFLDRCDIPFADSRALIRAGCFDELGTGLSGDSSLVGHSRPDLLLQLMEHQAPADARTQVSSSVLAGMEGQLHCPTHSDGRGRRRPPMRPLTEQQQFDMEMESFGYPVSWHPLEPFQEALKGRVTPARDIRRCVGRTITLAGVCLTTKTVKTRAGEPMEFLTFEDRTDLFECVLFPTKYKLFNDLVRWERLFLIRGKVEETWGVYTVTIEKLASLSRVMGKGIKETNRARRERLGVRIRSAADSSTGTGKK